MAMPLDQLEQLVQQAAAEYEGLLVGGTSAGGAPAPVAAPTPGPAGAPPVSAPPPAPPAPAPPAPGQPVDLSMMEPGEVQAAMQKLGVPSLTSDMLPELQQLADIFAPGLFDVVGTPADTIEFLTGVANGSIPLAPAAPGTPAGGPPPGGQPPGPVPGRPGAPGGAAAP